MDKAKLFFDTTPEQLVGLVFPGGVVLTLTFSDKEFPPEGSAHNKPLYISVECKEKWVPVVLVDTGSAINVCPSRIAYAIGLRPIDFVPIAQVIQAYDNTSREVMDTIVIPRKRLDQVLKEQSMENDSDNSKLGVRAALKRFNFTQSEYGGSAAAVVVLLCLPLAVVIKEEYSIWKSKKEAQLQLQLQPPSIDLKIVTENQNTETILPPSATSNGGEEVLVLPTSQKQADSDSVSCWRTIFQPPNRGDDYTILQALFSIDMLILFFATICGVGGTLTAIDNLGQIGASLGYPKRSISTFVSLVSIWNYLGRVVAGFVSEIFLTKYKFPRPLMLTFILLLSCLGHLLIAFNVPSGLYIASIIIGFCFGAQWPLLFAIISEVFGLKYYSRLYNFGSVASPIGFYILNVRVTGHLYDKEAERQGAIRKAGQGLNCVGVDCFKLSFIIITAVTVLGALVSVLLVIRTRKFYRSDIYKKFREEAEKEMAVAGNGAAGPVSETKVR
ncbi:uncharacterized protein LOC114321979 [Camellia sinensis]|uniref:uncharacterized protein LOC114321979 n=1 Tax=Camellia sinensis TaxID=4442 RepID=UPI0010369757|nr:uncharacterized protein LOC114321979 [Camellia sinensis]